MNIQKILEEFTRWKETVQNMSNDHNTKPGGKPPATSKKFPPRFVSGDVPESICKAVDDAQPVEKYDGKLGVVRAFVDKHQPPVGQIQWNNNLDKLYKKPGNVSDIRWCSGTMISEDLYLSAGHCFDSEAGNWEIPRINGT